MTMRFHVPRVKAVFRCSEVLFLKRLAILGCFISIRMLWLRRLLALASADSRWSSFPPTVLANIGWIYLGHHYLKGGSSE